MFPHCANGYPLRTARSLKKTTGSGSIYTTDGFGSADFSNDEYNAAHSALCQSAGGNVLATTTVNTLSSRLNSTAITAWSSCMHDVAVSLAAVTPYGSDDGQGPLNVTLSYVNSTGGGIQLKGYVTTGGLSCQGDMSKFSPGVVDTLLHGQARTLTCTRPVASSPYDIMGKKVWAGPASLTISTSQGDVVREYDQILAPANLPALEAKVVALEQQVKDVTTTAAAALLASGLKAFVIQPVVATNPGAGEWAAPAGSPGTQLITMASLNMTGAKVVAAWSQCSDACSQVTCFRSAYVTIQDENTIALHTWVDAGAACRMRLAVTVLYR